MQEVTVVAVAMRLLYISNGSKNNSEYCLLSAEQVMQLVASIHPVA